RPPCRMEHTVVRHHRPQRVKIVAVPRRREAIEEFHHIRFGTLVSGHARLTLPAFADPRAGGDNSIHDVPKRSRSIANRSAKNVWSIFMKISPPSASSAYTRSTSAALSS